MRVLLVEDDDRVARALTGALRRRGVHVVRESRGEDALRHREIDLVLLDLGLPDMDGLDVCRSLRRSSGVPVIAVTARGEEHQRVRGLRSGADDYVVKPFGIEELVARMEAVVRRARAAPPSPAGPEPTVLAVDGVCVDLDRREVTVDGQPVELTRKEFDVLAVLLREPGVVSRDRLVGEVWQTTWAGTSRSLDVHVASLRRKLGRPDLVQTVRGVGYRLAGG